MKNIILFFILMLSSLLLSTKAFAADISLGIYPPVTQIESNPPADIESPLTIQNYSNNPIDLTIEFRPFSPSPRFDGQIELLPETTAVNQKYLNLLQKVGVQDNGQAVSHITLSPQQQKQLTLSIVPTKDTQSGDYYFSVVFLSKAQSSTLTNASYIAAGIASNILLHIGPKDSPSGVIQDFSAPVFSTSGPIPMSLLVENTSSTYTQIKGVIVIKNIFGQVVGTRELLPVAILSHSSRFIPDNTSNTSTQIIWPEKVLLGVYTAHLRILLSAQGPLFEKTIWFVAIPTKYLVILCGLIFFITFVISKIFARIKSQNDFSQ